MLTVLFLAIFGVVGLIIGSFLTSLTFSLGRHNFSWPSRTWLWRRSICPRCRHVISWYDNIPLLSYFLLGGHCRSCGKKISLRYPLIEITTGVIFLLFGWVWLGKGLEWLLLYWLFVTAVLLSLAILDIEKLIIPDVVIKPFLIFNLLLLGFLLPPPGFFINFFWAGAAATFLYLLNLVTLGRGMGLGDVKLGFVLGLILGSLTWLMFLLAFILGAIAGLLLVAVKKASFGKPIPFGPFLILGTMLTILFGKEIVVILQMV